MYDLLSGGSQLGAGIALSFAAYLIGALSFGLFQKPLLVGARLVGKQTVILLSGQEGDPPDEVVAEVSKLGDHLRAPGIDSAAAKEFVEGQAHALKQYLTEKIGLPAELVTRETLCDLVLISKDWWPIALIIPSEGYVSQSGCLNLHFVLEDRLSGKSTVTFENPSLLLLGHKPTMKWIESPPLIKLAFGPFGKRGIAGHVEGGTSRLGALAGDGYRLLMILLLRELDLMFTRLIGESMELHSAVDRLRAEADFRLAVLPPLLCLSVTLAVQASIFWVATFPVLFLLYKQGIWRREEAGDLLVDALALHKVEAPSLEKLDLAAKKA